MKRTSKIRDALPLLGLLGMGVMCLIILYSTGVLQKLDIRSMGVQAEQLRGQFIKLGLWGPLVFLLISAIRPITLFPKSIICMLGGYLFGLVGGTILSVVGSVIGAAIAFWIAKKIGRGSLERLLGNKLKAFDTRAEKHGFTATLYMRLIPFLPFDGINYGAGLSRIQFRDFLLGTALGIIPMVYLYVSLGSSIWTGSASSIVAAVALYGIFALLPVALRKKK